MTGPQLVTARFKPKKQGVVKVPRAHTPRVEKEYRAHATSLMKTFCADYRAEITEITLSSAQSGSTSTALGGMVFTDIDTENASYVHFDCVDALASDL